MIASENIVLKAVLEAQGSVLTINMLKAILQKDITVDEHVDVSENLAIERAKKLFDCKFANYNHTLVLKRMNNLFGTLKTR